MECKQHPHRRIRHIASLPFIYLLSIPLVLLDLCVEIYHRVCFPLYGLPHITRRAYVKIDRQKLSYLSPIEKVNCMYCGYANGVLHYMVAIAGATERYWCGIRHQNDPRFIPPPHHSDFIPYGDEEAYKKLSQHKT